MYVYTLCDIRVIVWIPTSDRAGFRQCFWCQLGAAQLRKGVPGRWRQPKPWQSSRGQDVGTGAVGGEEGG